MPDLELPASMIPQLNKLGEEIRASYERELKVGREYLLRMLETGEWLKQAKDKILPEAWPRWCAEQVPFAIRSAERRIEFFKRLSALEEEKQEVVLTAAETVKDAMKLLQADKPASVPLAPKASGSSAPAKAEPDPWKTVREETSEVFKAVTTAYQTLRDAILMARGYGCFSFAGGLENELDTIKLTLSLSKPTELCPTCRPEIGPEAAKQCRACHSFGLVPKSVIEKGESSR